MSLEAVRNKLKQYDNGLDCELVTVFVDKEGLEIPEKRILVTYKNIMTGHSEEVAEFDLEDSAGYIAFQVVQMDKWKAKEGFNIKDVVEKNRKIRSDGEKTLKEEVKEIANTVKKQLTTHTSMPSSFKAK